MNERMSLLVILIAAACTLLMRALPFTLLGGRRRIPRRIRYLGRILPPAIMAVLVVYCLRGAATNPTGEGLCGLAAAAVCVGLHIWKRNTMLSILIATAVYMLLLFLHSHLYIL